MENITTKLDILGALPKFKAEGSEMRVEETRGIKKVVLFNNITGLGLVILNVKTYKEVEKFLDSAIHIYGGAI